MGPSIWSFVHVCLSVDFTPCPISQITHLSHGALQCEDHTTPSVLRRSQSIREHSQRNSTMEKQLNKLWVDWQKDPCVQILKNTDNPDEKMTQCEVKRWIQEDVLPKTYKVGVYSGAPTLPSASSILTHCFPMHWECPQWDKTMVDCADWCGERKQMLLPLLRDREASTLRAAMLVTIIHCNESLKRGGQLGQPQGGNVH